MISRMIIAASLVMFSPLASLSDGLIDCISLRNLYTKLGDSARRAEELKLNSVCPEKQFKQRLNTVSDWAWTIDTRARQYCRDEWRANSKPLYVNSTNKAFFSQDGALCEQPGSYKQKVLRSLLIPHTQPPCHHGLIQSGMQHPEFKTAIAALNGFFNLCEKTRSK